MTLYSSSISPEKSKQMFEQMEEEPSPTPEDINPQTGNKA